MIFQLYSKFRIHSPYRFTIQGLFCTLKKSNFLVTTPSFPFPSQSLFPATVQCTVWREKARCRKEEVNSIINCQGVARGRMLCAKGLVRNHTTTAKISLCHGGWLVFQFISPVYLSYIHTVQSHMPGIYLLFISIYGSIPPLTQLYLSKVNNDLGWFKNRKL